MLRPLLAALLAAAAIACVTRRDPAPEPPASPEQPAPPIARGAWLAELDAHRSADPGDLGAAYLAAYVAVGGGDTEAALRILEDLAAKAWPFPVADTDFPQLAALPRFRALATRLAATTPIGAARPAFTLGPADLVPEGIACDPTTGAVFVGSIVHRKIVRVDGTTPRDLVPRARDGLGAVLGMTVDQPRRWLWAAHNPPGPADRAAGGRSGLAAFDLDSGDPRASATLDGEHLLNDVTLTPAGDAYVTDSTYGAVWRLRGAAGSLEPVVPRGTFVYPNGLAWIDEAAALFVADAGGLHILDPATGQRRRAARGPAPTLAGVDGLQRVGSTLVAVQIDRVVRWTFDPSLAISAESVLLARHPSFTIPTTGCPLGDRYLIIANSHVTELDDNGAPKDPSRLRPLEVLAISLTP
jgi:hypothetical protein